VFLSSLIMCITNTDSSGHAHSVNGWDCSGSKSQACYKSQPQILGAAVGSENLKLCFDSSLRQNFLARGRRVERTRAMRLEELISERVVHFDCSNLIATSCYRHATPLVRNRLSQSASLSTLGLPSLV
jgi:hypothetical protein